MFSSAQQMKQQPDCCARLIGAAMFAVYIVGQKQSLHFLRLIVLIQKLPKTPAEKGNELRNLLLRDAAKALAYAKQVHPTLAAGGVKFRRRFHEKRLQVARKLFQLVIYLDKTRSVPGGNPGKLLPCALPLCPPGHDVAVWEWHLDRGITGNHAQAVVGQMQFGNHLRT